MKETTPSLPILSRMSCRPDRWLFGLPLLFLLAAACIWRVEPDLDAALRRGLAEKTGASLAAQGIRLDLDGRDLVVVSDGPATPASNAALSDVLASLPAIRRVTRAVDPPRMASPYRFTATRDGSVLRLAGHVPPGPLRADLLRLASGSAAGLVLEDALRTATGEAASFPAAARAAVAFAALLPDGRASIEGDRLELGGSAPDSERYDAALALVRTLAPLVEVSAAGLQPPSVARFTWSARKEGDRVELAGFVPSEAVRRTIAAAAGPAATTTDASRTARGPDPELPVEAVARVSLAWLARLQDGAVRLDDRTLSAEGTTPARDLVAELEAALRTRLPEGVGLGRVAVRTVPASPFRFEARRADGRIVLAGFVPAEADRTALAALARQRFPFEAVANDLHLADGAPPGLVAAAELALTRLSAFAEGEVALVDRAFRLSGRILYSEMAERARRGFGTGLPDGWSARLDIRDGSEAGLDDAQCGDLLQDAARREPVSFEAGSAELGPAGRRAVAAWAGVLRRCRRAAVALVGLIVSETDPEKARDLGLRRARAVAAGLGPALDGSTGRPEGRRIADGADRLLVETTP